MEKQSLRMSRPGAGLLVVDLQERLLPVMHEGGRVVQNAARLIRGSQVLGLPVLITEQYRKGLGPTVPEIAQAIEQFTPVEKLSFSACGSAEVMEQLKRSAVREVLVCGVEAHVCVAQTCLDLLDHGLRVFVAADAISSRTPENCQWGIGRMRDAGAVIVSTEMALFELLGKAGTEEFKKISSLVK